MNLQIGLTGGSGSLNVGAGSAPAPALSFTNDSDTGIYRLASDTISFAFSWTVDRAREFITTSLKAGLNKEFIRNEVIENLRNNLVALELFDEYGLL